MAKTIWVVKYHMDMDGGFGDAVDTEDNEVAFDNEEAAKEYVKKYSNPHVYSEPWDILAAGELTYEPLELRSKVGEEVTDDSDEETEGDIMAERINDFYESNIKNLIKELSDNIDTYNESLGVTSSTEISDDYTCGRYEATSDLLADLKALIKDPQMGE